MYTRPSSPMVIIFLFLCTAIAIFAPISWAQVRVPDLQDQFVHESNPIRKAKLLQRLGDAQFLQAHREQARENYDGVVRIYETYRDNVRASLTGLRGARPDAERHSDGYRQLQIQLRKGLRDLEETILSTPEELRSRLQSLRTDLITCDEDLIKLLFPRRRKPEPQKPGAMTGSKEPPDAEKLPGGAQGPQSSKLQKPETRPLAQESSQIDKPVSATTESSKPGTGEATRVVEPTASSSGEAEQERRVVPRTFEKKDYLSELEADKIRDAETSNQRIKLLLTFAADRLKKFQYELAHPSASGRHNEMLVFLMNAYAGCVDDAAEYIDAGREKQENVHDGIKEMLAKGKEFLVILEELSAKGPEREIYKDTLDDAIEGTRDAVHDADKAKKEIAAPPVRRRN
ncbi:MAG TPA: hypothetical protein VOA41_12255 [Candidatus Dormibacteraeota bacterium]|nr:hypothetical protein [Candidatus Dormibacteraeota bacterium]